MTRVLVIDDEIQIRRLLRISLEKQGFDVYEAETGKDGVRMVLVAKPDIIILDLGLPDRDGLSVLTELRA